VMFTGGKRDSSLHPQQQDVLKCNLLSGSHDLWITFSNILAKVSELLGL